MSSRERKIEQLFLEALEKDAACREAFLREACGDDTALLSELNHLLAASADSERYFDALSNRIGASALLNAEPAPALRAGAEVGSYRLLREIGSGGMATVWLAERVDGLINRPVALKFPHGAWRMAGLVERMEQERNILAQLAHPNIARLYDAGLTADGQPWLALEYIEGTTVDRYCQEKGLPVSQRLRLFLQVARAVAHAHARLVVHRDLKPSNVLVTTEGYIRLLDFGIAKLLAQEAREGEALTAISGHALTIDYASPEQILGQPISIATDIYSLGVLLFQVLTGQRPYRLERESRGALEEAILRADPPRPSDCAPAGLRKELRGDVDNIVLKALRKKPEDRYATVDALIEDIERHFAHLPVLARPDSWRYRAGRFVARNRLAVTAAAVTAVAIVGGGASALLQAHAADLERRRAEDINAFIASILERTDPYHEAGAQLTGEQLLLLARDDLAERFPDQPDRRIELLNIIGAGLIGLGNLQEAEVTLQRALEEATAAFGGEDVYSLQARLLLAEILSVRRDPAGARAALIDILPSAREQLEARPDILIRALKLQTDVALELGEYDQARGPVTEAVGIARARLGRNHPLSEAVVALLAETHVMYTDSIDEMLQVTQQALEETLAAHPQRPDHAQVLRLREIRSRALGVAGMFRESVAETRATVDALQRRVGRSTLEVGNALSGLASYERRLGEFAVSLAHSEEALRILGDVIERKSADYAGAVVTRGITRLLARRPGEALEDLDIAHATYREMIGDRHGLTLTTQMYRATALASLGRRDEALAALALGREPADVSPNPPWWIEHETGIVQRLAGDFRQAIASQDRALGLIRPGPRAPWDEMRALNERGLAEFALGEREAATRSMSAAIALYERLRLEMHPAYADALTVRGALALDRDSISALRDLERADQYWRKSDAENPAGGGTALWLARCYAKLGRHREAAMLSARARQLLAKSPLPYERQLQARFD